MKRIMILSLVLFTNFAVSQNLPILKLENLVDTTMVIKSPLEINKDEICVTLVIGGGTSAYDYYTHYVFTNDGDVKVFKEEIPKQYLKIKNLKQSKKELDVNKDQKQKISNNINSKLTLEFLKFTQQDFFKLEEKRQYACVEDGTSYAISFIQNKKQNIYWFYAPKSYYRKQCGDENINRIVLDKFIELIELWDVIK